MGSCYLVDILVICVKCHGVTFDLCSARMFSTARFETYFTYHKTIWIAEIVFYVIAVSPLIPMHQFISDQFINFPGFIVIFCY